MKYRTPEVFDIGVRMQKADGQVSPNACVPGGSAGYWESCGDGGAAGPWESCYPGGNAAGTGDCLSGTGVKYYCSSGSGGNDDPYGCNVGPSYGV